jgi:hypothetical protein
VNVALFRRRPRRRHKNGIKTDKGAAIMINDDNASDVGTPPSPKDVGRVFSSPLQRYIIIAATVFAGAAAGAFLYGIVALIYKGGTVPFGATISAFEFWRDLIQPNFNVFAIVGIGLLCAFFSVSLFSKAGSITAQVIPPQDRHLLEPLIKGPNKDAIGEYIRLASLSGFSGTFTKLGFTGLPLATVALTLIFLGVSIFVSDAELKKSVFDMAKLTLGAFIGSFVQRNIEQERLVSGVGSGGVGSGGGGTGGTGSSDGQQGGGSTGNAAESSAKTTKGLQDHREA